MTVIFVASLIRIAGFYLLFYFNVACLFFLVFSRTVHHRKATVLALLAMEKEGDHAHCLSCFNRRCSVRPETGVSCDLVSCPLLCGAVFHSCKSDEHQLLCPLLKVPCINSGYGCPASLVRVEMSAHLEVCPAGVVCCTMEWNRWPVSCLNYTSYESLNRGTEEVEQLDMALALQDQRTLLDSLKVIAMAPTVGRETPVIVVRENMASAAESSPSQQLPPASPAEKIASGINGVTEEHFSKLYQATVETARSLAAALDFVSNASSTECVNNGAIEQKIIMNNSGLENKISVVSNVLSTKTAVEERSVSSSSLLINDPQKETDLILNTANGPTSENLMTCLCTAPSSELQDNINVAVSQEMLTSDIGQAKTPNTNHVVIGPLETHGANVELNVDKKHLLIAQGPSSLPHGQACLVPAYQKPKMEDKSVDTSDLEPQEDPISLSEIDPITAALLFCLEESRDCRRISDTVFVDGYHVDFGTQTFTFPAAILLTNTRVGDMASASACDHAAPLSYPSPFHTLRLGLVLEALEGEVIPHNRYFPSNPRHQHTFPFVCGQCFRRDQFSSHFTNVHGDIHAGLNGWMEHRCPLAYYGCSFSQRRFYPSTEVAKVVHDRHLRSFGVQPCPKVKPASISQSVQFSELPIEILWHIARFLDSFSLCQLSLVSRTMREVCASLLQTRGIVELQWERKHCPGSVMVSWQVKNKVS